MNDEKLPAKFYGIFQACTLPSKEEISAAFFWQNRQKIVYSSGFLAPVPEIRYNRSYIIFAAKKAACSATGE
ncbi:MULTISPECIES: hypothetical protein [Anaerotruncus]|uniref:Uncharacterized protein n=1 Tax=Anaerotruncus massiliensis (ex Togo et al. 2019) TaxID=1673720 RepID=A0ABR7ADG1_9FIRM|nr:MULTISPECIES: hypothetical protein [Anaerotruncus]MBC3938480.1 hypothetical protein [Anaerotruncus massiliensis (ex Togo et al. 2019)]MCQ4896616.1 hypothetical protein [Anaerotruncus sp. DFI.9.16]